MTVVRTGLVSASALLALVFGTLLLPEPPDASGGSVEMVATP